MEKRNTENRKKEFAKWNEKFSKMTKEEAIADMKTGDNAYVSLSQAKMSAFIKNYLNREDEAEIEWLAKFMRKANDKNTKFTIAEKREAFLEHFHISLGWNEWDELEDIA